MGRSLQASESGMRAHQKAASPHAQDDWRQAGGTLLQCPLGFGPTQPRSGTHLCFSRHPAQLRQQMQAAGFLAAAPHQPLATCRPPIR